MAPPLPLSPERAAQITAAAPTDPFGRTVNLRGSMTPSEYDAVRRYWMAHAPGGWSFNDTVRACATVDTQASEVTG